MQLPVRLLLASILIFITGFTGIFEPFRNIGQSVFNPIQFGLYSVSSSFSEAAYFFSNLKSIRDDNILLQERVEELQSQTALLNETLYENRELKEELHLQEDSETNQLVMADVIGIPFDNDNSELLINKGSKDGVVLSATVSYKGFLVGSVVDVFENRSVVVLVTSPRLSVAALNQSSDGRAKGLVTGDFGTSLLMDRILPDEEIRVGDVIVTSGQDGTFEKGLIIGRVVEVTEIKSEPLKKAKLETFLNLNKIERVFVRTAK